MEVKVIGQMDGASKTAKEVRLGNIYGFDGGNYAGNVYGTEGICPTIRTFQGGNQQPCIVKAERMCEAMREMNPHNLMSEMVETEVRYRIRKLTPRETWRLMDFSDEDFDKAQAVNSQTQLYKEAGNSIVVNVLVAIFGQMIPGRENVYRQLGGVKDG